MMFGKISGGFLVLFVALAGCSGGPAAPQDFRAPSRDFYVFNGFTWRDPTAFDSGGDRLAEHRLLVPGDLPSVVEQLLPDSGASYQSLIVTGKDHLFVVGPDHLYRSHDLGRTWDRTQRFVGDLYPTTRDVAEGPGVVGYDSRTGRLFLHMFDTNGRLETGGRCDYLAYSDDEGGNWTEPDYTNSPHSCLRGYSGANLALAVAPPGPRAGPGVLDEPRLGDAYEQVVYVCFTRGGGASAHCSMSFDSGHSFPRQTEAVPSSPTEGGLLDSLVPCDERIMSEPVVFPDGSVALTLSEGHGCQPKPFVAITEDNGATWQIRTFEAAAPMNGVPALAVGTDGTAYLVYRSHAPEPGFLVARSHDKFQTWEGPFLVQPPVGIREASVNAVLQAGDAGRLVIGFYGTRENLTVYDEGVYAPGAHWHFFVAESLDADGASPTYVTLQVTPEEDPAFVGWLEWVPMDSGMTGDGRFFFTFADGCTPRIECPGDTDAVNGFSFDAQLAIAVQDAGQGMFEDAGSLPRLGLQHPLPFLPKGSVDPEARDADGRD